jgi:hypothetical protein
MEFLRISAEKNGNKIFEGFTDGLYDLKTNITCEELISMTGKELSK